MTKEQDTSENKTERVQVLMTPTEVRVIDDWGFASRIRSRSEAIRRLCSLGLAVGDIAMPMRLAFDKITDSLSNLRDFEEACEDDLANYLQEIRLTIDNMMVIIYADVAALHDLAEIDGASMSTDEYVRKIAEIAKDSTKSAVKFKQLIEEMEAEHQKKSRERGTLHCED